MSNISVLLKQVRKKHNLTQKQLSDICGGFNPQFISLIENGHSELPLPIAKIICESLKIDKKKFISAFSKDYSKFVSSKL